MQQASSYRAQDFEEQLVRFDNACRGGHSPDILAFLPRPETPTPPGHGRGELLIELVMVDLEYQWRHHRSRRGSGSAEQNTIVLDQASQNTRLRLEDYAEQFPELGPVENLSLELIVQEYRVRQRWGDRPNHNEYVSRFSAPSGPLLRMLSDIDDELSKETEPRRLPGTDFGDYELIEVIGEGGMGTVYKARDKRLDRLVALKMIRSGRFASPPEVRRFHDEAKIVATLEHSNIVPIHDVGEHEGRCFFSMRLIQGADLSRRVSDFSGDANRTAQLIETIARAVQYAHQRGILHRDLKPANVLIDSTGQPHVTDFGLAKRLDANSTATRSGAVMGTVQFMSPEQAAGLTDEITTVSDVYGLGTILYTLLVGRPPFGEGSPLQIQRQVLESVPQPPRSLRPSIPPDLETICLKCLEKKPAHRYSSALAMAEDLQRFQLGEPVTARRVSPPERLLRWCLRKPVAAGLLATIGVLLLSLVIGVPVVIVMADYTKQLEVRNQEIESLSLLRAAVQDRRRKEPGWRKLAEKSLIAAVQSGGLQRSAVQLRSEAVAVITSYDPVTDGLLKNKQGHPSDLPLSAGLIAFGTGNNSVAFRYPESTETAVPEAIQGDSPVASLATNCDGKRLIVAWASGKIQAFNVADQSVLRTVQVEFYDDRKKTPLPVALHPNGKTMALVAGSMQIRLYNVETQGWSIAGLRKAPDRVDQQRIRHHDNGINSLCFSPDGKWLASASDDYTVKVTPITRSSPPIILNRHWGPVTSVRYSPDGELLVTTSTDGSARLWEAASGRQVHILWPQLDELLSVTISPDSRAIAIGGRRSDGTDATIGYRRSGQTARRRMAGHLWASLSGIAFHPAKRLFAIAAGDQEIIFRDSQTGAHEERVGDRWIAKGNRGALVDIAFGPSGDLIAVAPREIIYPSPDRPQDDTNIYLWRWKNWKHTDAPQVVLQGHQKVIRSFGFAPFTKNVTRNELAAGDASGVTIVWDLTTGKPRQRFDDSSHGSVLAVAYLDRGTKLVTAHEDGYLAVRNVSDGELHSETTLSIRPSAANVMSDGKRLVIGKQTGGLVIVSLPELNTLVSELVGADLSMSNLIPSRPIERIALTALGHLGATASGRTVTLWDLKNYKKLCTLPAEEAPILNLAFDPHTGHLIVCGKSDLVTRWDIQTLRRQLAKVRLDW